MSASSIFAQSMQQQSAYPSVSPNQNQIPPQSVYIASKYAGRIATIYLIMWISIVIIVVIIIIFLAIWIPKSKSSKKNAKCVRL